jgi:acyl carrier protein
MSAAAADADEIRRAVLGVLGGIAPEADLSALDPARNFIDQLEIDSMDLLNLAIGIHERLGIDVPESDYPKLASLRGCIDYLGAKLAARAG